MARYLFKQNLEALQISQSRRVRPQIRDQHAIDRGVVVKYEVIVGRSAHISLDPRCASFNRSKHARKSIFAKTVASSGAEAAVADDGSP